MYNKYKGNSTLTKKMKLLAQRTERIYTMRYEKRMTLKEIGIELGITRERVRQILRNCYGKNSDFLSKNGNSEWVKPLKKYQPITCVHCSKEFSIRERLSKKYCSDECRLAYRNTRSRFPGIFDKAELNRLHASTYYHTHKNEPDFIEKIKQNNKRMKESGYLERYYAKKKKDPAYIAKLRAYSIRKWAEHKERMSKDAIYAEETRRKQRVRDLRHQEKVKNLKLK